MSKRKIFIVSILSVIFILLTVLVMFDKTRSFDMMFYNFLMNFRCDMLDNYFTFITKLGDVAFILGLIFGVVIYFRNKESVLYTLLAVDCTITNKIIKHLVRRDRPSVLKLIKQGGYSYPSGHTMISMCMYGYAIYAVNKYIKNKKLKNVLNILLEVLIISIGLSRVYVGVHYISDVIAGYILAIIILILYIELSERYLFRGN